MLRPHRLLALRVVLLPLLKDKAVVLGEPEDEIELRKKEAAEFSQLVDDHTKNDVGCSATGLYEFVGEFFLSDPFNRREGGNLVPLLLSYRHA